MATLPTIPASLTATIKKLAEDVVTTGVSIGAILAAVENIAPSLHIGGEYTAWIVVASAVVAAIVAQARRVAGAKLAAKHAPVPVPVVPKVQAPPVKEAVKKAPAKKVPAKKVVKKTSK
jgi:hypothetical protein